MQNVPKIVRERLRAAPPAVNHPDADALTAFAERSLPALERDVVLEHLARCGDCRDIVALALPATEQTEVTPARAVAGLATAGWLTWPAIRWGFAAGIVAIVSLGIVKYRQSNQPTTTASKLPVPEATTTEARNQPISVPPSPVPAEKREKIVASPAAAFTGPLDQMADQPVEKDKGTRNLLRAEPQPAVEAPSRRDSNVGGPSTVTPGALPHGPRATANQQWQSNSNNRAYAYTVQNQTSTLAVPSAPTAKQQSDADASANLRVPAASQTVEVSGAAPMLDATTQNVETARAENLPVAQSAEEASVAKAKAAVPNQEARGALTSTVAPYAAPPVAGMKAPGDLRWTINSAGTLQRSFDQGKTWQDIDVSATSDAEAAMTLEVVATSRAKASADKKLKAHSHALVFRAVTAAGMEVWAGGSAGALYHSIDGGAHWMRVVPSSTGGTLTGDIVSVQFPDATHGTIGTSTAEVWITADNGQTWQKQ